MREVRGDNAVGGDGKICVNYAVNAEYAEIMRTNAIMQKYAGKCRKMQTAKFPPPHLER